MLFNTYFARVLSNTMTPEATDVITATTDDASSLTSFTAASGGEMTSRMLLQSLTSLAMEATTTAAAAAAEEAAAADDEAAYLLLVRQQVNWYTVIAILSALVLVGMCFTICRLVMKANAHEKAGEGWTRDSLLYSRKDSIIPISLHFDQTEDNYY